MNINCCSRTFTYYSGLFLIFHVLPTTSVQVHPSLRVNVKLFMLSKTIAPLQVLFHCSCPGLPSRALILNAGTFPHWPTFHTYPSFSPRPHKKTKREKRILCGAFFHFRLWRSWKFWGKGPFSPLAQVWPRLGEIQSLVCPVNLKGLHHRDLKHLSSSGDYDDFQPRHNFWDVLGSPRSKFLHVDVDLSKNKPTQELAK